MPFLEADLMEMLNESAFLLSVLSAATWWNKCKWTWKVTLASVCVCALEIQRASCALLQIYLLSIN